jgi:deazaflavin-dependent oxidoreductase (nitroreductase family)
MPLEGEYEPSSWDWVREQVAAFEASGGQEANTFADTGLPIIVMTNRGNKSGKLRKTPLMRVEHEGAYALIASVGGAPQNPVWYHNLKADPQVTVQDGGEVIDAVAEEVEGDERAAWWDRAVAAYSDYQVYQDATERRIPVFVTRRT